MSEDTQGDRDTQFAGFANLLFGQLSEHGLIALVDMFIFRNHPELVAERQEEINRLIKQIFAQRAYDLVYHSHCVPQSAASIEEVVRSVPDMTAWPEETK